MPGGWTLVLVAVAGLACGGLLATGGRRLLGVFRINPRRMTVARLKLGVLDASNVERVDTILRHFLGGFNRTITSRSCSEAAAYCGSVPALYEPFAHEGMAMGYTLNKLFRYDAETFEREVVSPRPEFRYLYYVGLGFWWGMRNFPPERVERFVEGLDPMHRYLCFDGYGFKVAFFESRKDPKALDRLERFTGYARHAAYQGVGRAMYFLHMDEPGRMIDRITALGSYAADAAAGVGLAIAFVNPDRLERAFETAERMPEAWRPHVHLGMCFGLKARAINEVDQFEHDLSRYDEPVQLAIRSSIRECDRVELLTRADGKPAGYRRWRERVTDWLSENVDYPMASVNVESDTCATAL